jgi:rhodanese-related sulfurtransferase
MKVHNPGFLTLVDDAKLRVKQMSVTEYEQLANSGEPFVFIDVREDHEWNAAHPTGAVHLSKGIIERDIEDVVPDKDRKLVLMCGGGYRATLAADNLHKMGYSGAVSLDGGWRAWQAAGLPIES